MVRLALAAAGALTTLPQPLATAQLATHASSLVPGSRVAVRFANGHLPDRIGLVGAGTLDGSTYVVADAAQPSRVTLVASSGNAFAVRSFRIVAPPTGPVIAVAAYDDGIVFHNARTFATLGTLATAGRPSDLAVLDGTLFATDTDGTAMTAARLAPWSVTRVSGVPLGDEVAPDPALHAFFVTERGVDGRGGVARIARGAVASVVTGTTAEGVAVDVRRNRVYVADVNDDAIAIVDARTLRVVGRIGHVPRVFSLALSRDGTRLYAVSNQGAQTIFAVPGGVTEFDVAVRPHVVAKSAELSFPLGIAIDDREGAIFVTDEAADVVDVLDARTLRARRQPVRTCRTPWKPTFDAESERLYVPCAQSDEVDAFDARTLRRVRGAPFHTGGYPLAVSVVRP